MDREEENKKEREEKRKVESKGRVKGKVSGKEDEGNCQLEKRREGEGRKGWKG